MPHRVIGKILETETGWGVPNVLVEVWDVDPVGEDDRLGSVVTGPDGSFTLIYRDEDFQDAMLDRKPDLRLLLKRSDGSLLVDAAAEVRQEAGKRATSSRSRTRSLGIWLPRMVAYRRAKRLWPRPTTC